ncbi:uncharacterized protein DMAD_05827 [Drosophila madeirensis]|uniref:Uncharacterized protein n=1 Tax=Drosophila madeirensis TaxID=30013 RepID=A0AAU9FPK9_DROMD
MSHPMMVATINEEDLDSADDSEDTNSSCAGGPYLNPSDDDVDGRISSSNILGGEISHQLSQANRQSLGLLNGLLNTDFFKI